MTKLSTFQLVVFIIFVLGALGGMLLFSTLRGDGRTPASSVIVWGTLPASTFEGGAVSGGQTISNSKVAITYFAKSPNTFLNELVEALAVGRGPDVVFFSDDLYVSLFDKLYPIPFETVSARTFKDTFLEAGEIYTLNNGYGALPVVIDPLLLFWNRSLFTNAGLVRPPKYWEELFSVAEKLTKKDGTGGISKSALPFGQFTNVTNAKAILATLFLQAGSPIASWGESGVVSSLGTGTDRALGFYTDFGNPSKSVYAWNRALPESRKFFTAGMLGLYPGFASEINDIRERSPFLNFDIGEFPQPERAINKVTYGRLYGAGVLQASADKNSAIEAVLLLSSAPVVAGMANKGHVSGARRDTLVGSADDPLASVITEGAIRTKVWLDPNPSKTTDGFEDMVDSVGSGESRLQEAVKELAHVISASGSRGE